MKAWASAAILICCIASPQSVSAHGELLIRIGEATKKIEAATNHLATLYLQRGELYREDQNWAEAEADYSRAAQQDPKLEAGDFCRAKLLDDSGQLEASRDMFNKVIARSPKNGEAFIGRARVLVKLNEPQPATADFQEGLKLLTNPKSEYFLELAQILMTQNKTDEALHTLDSGIKKFGPIVPLQLYALELELARKNTDAALSRLDTIIERAERKENWLARRGDILLAAGRSAEARKSFNASLAAIKLLPMVLQKASPMQNLQSRVQMALDKTAAPSLSQNSK